jgi:hypothetical protein
VAFSKLKIVAPLVLIDTTGAGARTVLEISATELMLWGIAST